MRTRFTMPSSMRPAVPPVAAARTKWQFRCGVLVLIALAFWFMSGWMRASIGRSLVCTPDGRPSDALVIDNFDNHYLVFERASDLRHSGRATRVLVPVTADVSGLRAHKMAIGFTDVMARIARLGPYEVVPARHVEPISLNVARDVLAFLKQHGIRSITLVSPVFRSRRSVLIYTDTLAPAGIRVSCEPSAGPQETEAWTDTWHGIQNVVEQWIKLQYYRLYVLPFAAD